MGGTILYECDKKEAVVDNYFTNDIEVIVNEEFLKNNEENRDKWDKNNIKFIVKDKEDKHE